MQPRLAPNSNTETFAKMSFLTKRKFSVPIISITRCAAGTMFRHTGLKTNCVWCIICTGLIFWANISYFLTKAALLLLSCCCLLFLSEVVLLRPVSALA